MSMMVSKPRGEVLRTPGMKRSLSVGQSMLDIVTCPNCNRRLQVQDDVMGKQVQCPSCETTFTAGETRPRPQPAPVPQGTRRICADTNRDGRCDDGGPLIRRTP